MAGLLTRPPAGKKCKNNSGRLRGFTEIHIGITSVPADCYPHQNSAMRKYLLLPALLLHMTVIAQLGVKELLVENRTNPIGIDAAAPRFSWQLVSGKPNILQTAYEIRVANHPTALGKTPDLFWRSGKIASDSSVHVAYKGRALQPGQKYYWQVRVWDNQGGASNWSEPAFWQMGLLQPADWKAQWIEPGYAEPETNRPSPLFRKEFTTAKKVRSATAYITAHGLYEASINGKRIGDSYLTPGWTSYNKRLQYQMYDVANLLSQGNNAIGVTLGSGWYRGYLAWSNNKNSYGKDIALLFQLDITCTDGTTASIVSDGTWKSSTGSILNSEIYHGETIDARKEKTGWQLPGYNDAGWNGVNVKDHSKAVLVATENEPIKKHETFSAVKIITTPKGEKVIDFGQNLVGWVVVKVNGNAGDSINISHAEVLDKQGNFYTENLRAAKAQASYILKGGGAETFEPHFTFYGFRYIRLDDYPGEIKPENFTAVALYSAMPLSGSFTCSNPMINQLQHNIQWGQNGNFLDVPTDCPQRDERLGWTGDAQVFANTAAFNRNVNSFFSKWLKDIAADQQPNGSVPWVVPNVLGPNNGASAGWADAATIIPWNMYLAYGDKKILENQYNSMKSWVGYMTANSTNDLWNKGFHFGDWLFYRPFDDNDGRSAVTDKYLIAQCFYAQSTQLLINAANVLGKTADAENYKALLQRIKDAFLKEYVTPNGRLVSSTQTAYVLALNFDMLPENLRTYASQQLVENIKSYNYHLTTGFLGTPYLCHVLSRFGQDSVAYKLLLQTTYPSWLYPVKMGATTIWERWDGMKPDSTFQVPGMNSFNHYAYGAIGEWMYRNVAGINTDEAAPGYKKIIIRPTVGGNLTHASASLQTYYGKVSSGWKIETDGSLVLEVEIPANTTARIFVPDGRVEEVGSGKHQFVVRK
jgi:alpha-L-rhamnosidase